MNSEKDIFFMKFHAYLKKALIYCKVRYIRKSRINNEVLRINDSEGLSHSSAIDGSYDPESGILTKLTIESAIKKADLSEIDIKIIHWYYYERKTDKSISKILGITPQGVFKRRKSILQKLSLHI